MNYYNTLTTEEKGLVSNYSYLMYAYEQGLMLKDNFAKANELSAMITYSQNLQDVEYVKFVKAVYESLTEEQKALVKNAAVIDELYERLVLREIVISIENKINAFDANLVTAADAENLTEIKNMIDSLTEEQKAVLSEEAISKLEEMLNKIKQ